MAVKILKFDGEPLIFRGLSSQEHETFVGQDREVIVNTTDNRLRVHDGITPGGHELTKEADVPTTTSQLVNDVYRTTGNLTKLSQLTADIQYIKQSELTKLSQLSNDKGYVSGHCTYCTYCAHCTHCS